MALFLFGLAVVLAAILGGLLVILLDRWMNNG
jgi:hypothetical protein